MKKILFIAAIAVFTSFAFSSCSACQVCTKASEDEVRVCEKDYNNNTEYGFTIDTYEALGFKCKASI